MKGLLTSFALLLVLAGSAFTQPVIIVGDNELDPTLDFFRKPLTIPYPLARDFNGVGARAKGMGNAYLAVSDDISAISWNPAGLYQKDAPFDAPVFGISYQRFSAKDKFGLSNPILGDQSSSRSDAFTDIDMVAFVAPIRIKGHPFVGSINYNRLGDEYYTVGSRFLDSMSFTAADSVDNIRSEVSSVTNGAFHSGINVLNLGFGTRLYNNLSFGFAVNIYSGTGTNFESQTTLAQNVPVGDLQRALVEFDASFIDTMSYSGVYLTTGLRYSGEKLSAGVVLKTPHALKQERDRAIVVRGFRNGLETGEGQLFYFDNNIDEIDMPMVLGVGLAVRPSPRLLLASDIEYRPHSGGEFRRRDSLRIVPGDKDTEFFTTENRQWNNTLVFRVGTEFLLNSGVSWLGDIPLRAGFGRTPIPEPDIEGNTSGTTAKTYFSMGAGVHWDQIHLDFSLVHSTLDRHQIIADEATVGTFGVISVTSESSSDSFNMTFTGYF